MPAWLPLSFGTPLILAALVALPVLWWLLRVTPPLPRRTLFPPLRLLRGLEDEEQTPAATPWWLLLLRLIAAALLIVALADPLLGRSPKLAANGPLVLVVDNGWTAAHDWEARQDMIADLLHSAQGRAVAIIPTAGSAPTGLLNAGEAARIAKELKPMPWPGDRAAAAAALGRFKFAAAPALYWLSDGLEDAGHKALHDAMHRYGAASVYAPARLATGLLPVTRDASGFVLTATRAATRGAQDIEAGAIGARGETLAATKIHFRRGEARGHGHIALPMEVRNATARAGDHRRGLVPASVQLLDKGASQRSAGIVSEAGNGEGQPLLSDVYYLERALSPYADISKGGIAALLDKHVSVLLLPDVAKISGDDLGRVKDFVSKGGVLIRFAGDRMTGGADDLVPVHLRVGGRYLGSAMAWGAPQHLGSFGALSPFNGLEVPSRSDGDAPDPGRAVRRTSGAHMGATGRRHAADHRTANRIGMDRAVPCHGQPQLVVAAVVGTVCGYAQTPAGAVGGHPGARPGGADQPAAGDDPGRFRSSGAAAGRSDADRGA